jgi:ketosteroid isomerase-like protein
MPAADEVLSVFSRFRDALFSNDVDTLDAIMAPDYRAYNLRGGLEERDLVLQAYCPGVVKMERFETSDLQVEIFGEIGIVTGCGFVAGLAGGEQWEHDLRFCDIYRRTGERWQLHLSFATPLDSE